MRVLKPQQAARLGFSPDKRRRRREHRAAARRLLASSGGGTVAAVAHWHCQQARYLGR